MLTKFQIPFFLSDVQAVKQLLRNPELDRDLVIRAFGKGLDEDEALFLMEWLESRNIPYNLHENKGD